MNKILSIILPTYKEAENISVLVEKIDSSLDNNLKKKYEVIIIDDNSKDNIDKIVKKLQNKFPLHLKIRTNKKGLSSAVVDGIKIAKGDIILVMDADNSHPPKKIPELIKPIIDNKSEFVIGSRFVKGGSIVGFNYFRNMNAFFSRIFARLFTNVKDPMSGFFAFPKKIISNINILNPLGFKIGLEMIVKFNPKNMQEIPITFEKRLYGESKLSIKQQLLYLLHIYKLFLYKFKSFAEFILYSFVGLTGMVIDLSFVFFSYDILNIPFRIARIIGFIFSLTSNFILNSFITFPNTVKKNFTKQYFLYLLICLIGLSINWIISVSLFENINFFHKYYLIASAIGVLSGFIINFIGSKFLVYNIKVFKK